MKQIEVSRTASDQLTQEVWAFYFNADDARLVLDAYTQWSRPTTRHKFRFGSAYHRLDHRGSAIPLADVPFWPGVIAEAKQQLIDRIVVSKYWRAGEEAAPTVEDTARWYAASQARQAERG